MQGYALLCVGFPSSDLEVETQDEDEVMCKMPTSYYRELVIENNNCSFDVKITASSASNVI